MVEYGGDHATRQLISQEHKIRYPFLCHPYAFKVCRIEPENNVPMILAAFAELPEYPLVLVGNWQNSEFGRSMKARYSSYPNLHLLDADSLILHCAYHLTQVARLNAKATSPAQRRPIDRSR